MASSDANSQYRGSSNCRFSGFSGQIQVIFGPMFSGKTTELIRRVRRYRVANLSCLLIKYAKDVRYSEKTLSTHDQQDVEKEFDTVSTTKLYDIKMETLADSHVIGIDEGQFFPDVVEFCENMANDGKVVVVAALDGTFQRSGFYDILNLVPLAESVIKLNAVCMQCFKDAAFSKRTSEETEVEVIGGADKYLAVCRVCYHSKSNEVTSPTCKQ